MSLELNAEELTEIINEVYKDTKNIKRVNSALENKGKDYTFALHRKSKSSKKASDNQGVRIEEIIKSLVFVGDEPVLVLVQGNKKASEEKVRQAMGADSIELASPQEVKKITGYRVGTVSPFDLDIKVIIDKSIMDLEVARTAAGSTCVGIEMTPEDLKRITDAEVYEVSK